MTKGIILILSIVSLGFVGFVMSVGLLIQLLSFKFQLADKM